MGPRIIFLIFPAITTISSGLVLFLMRFPGLWNFPGKNKVRDLPAEYQEPVMQRTYQVGVMAMIMTTIVLGYVQINLALYATGQIMQFDPGPLIGVIAIMAVYILFNMIVLFRMSGQLADLHKQHLATGEAISDPEEMKE